MDIIARLNKADVNWPNYSAWPFHKLVPEVEFEAAVYELLKNAPHTEASELHFYRVPIQHLESRTETPADISGRALFLFGRSEGEKNLYADLCAKERVSDPSYLQDALLLLKMSDISSTACSKDSGDFIQPRLAPRIRRDLVSGTSFRATAQVLGSPGCLNPQVLP